jgi:hypothetical protein
MLSEDWRCGVLDQLPTQPSREFNKISFDCGASRSPHVQRGWEVLKGNTHFTQDGFSVLFNLSEPCFIENFYWWNPPFKKGL